MVESRGNMLNEIFLSVDTQGTSFSAQLLASLASGRISFPRRDLREFKDYFDSVYARVRGGNEGDARSIRLDFAHAPIPAELAALEDEPIIEIQVLAYDYARKFWSHAIETMAWERIHTSAPDDWKTKVANSWLHCQHVHSPTVEQGWKLHVSATPNSAPEVLDRCLDVLLRYSVSFKHAATLEYVEHLTSSRCDRSAGGKFITVYPPNPDSARELAMKLHEATLGLEGPAILSDRAYCPGSLVHYRYGAFMAQPELTNDGSYEARVRDPEGGLVQDERKAWFSPPDWVEPLFNSEGSGAISANSSPSSVLLKDRFSVHGAIRHANRGGVYRATDTSTSENVIIKQARPCTCAELSGDDARTMLRRESENLLMLGSIAPRHVDFFEYQGDCFLVQAAIDGTTLTQWVNEQFSSSELQVLDTGRLRELSAGVSALLVQIHRLGLVCRDFTPHNIMLDQRLRLTLIDPELVARPGSMIYRYFTFGFGAPELGSTPRISVCPGAQVDFYSLGATFYFIATGLNPPVFLEGQSREMFRVAWINALSPLFSAGLRKFAQLIIDLVDLDPNKRPSLEDVRLRIGSDDFWALDKVAASRLGAAEGAPELAADLSDLEMAINDGIDFIVETKEKDDRGPRLWRSGPFGTSTDECNVQHGAGGILGALCFLHLSRKDERLLPVIRDVSLWIQQRLAQRQRFLPGMYFGASGPIWANLEAAKILGDDQLRDSLVEMILRLPTRWPNPDICHGSAGAGLALCRAWLHVRDSRLLQSIIDCADGLIASVKENDDGIYWQVDDDFDSTLRGLKQYGFAHGIAGVGYFLLAAGLVADRPKYIEAARRAGDSLLAAVEHTPHGARWRGSVDSKIPSKDELYYYWCSGSAGIGTFLVRLWLVTQDERYRIMAEEAARAVRIAQKRAGTAVCHGLAGNGEFLIDMAAFVSPVYGDWVKEHAVALLGKRIERGGRKLIPDESGTDFTADYNTGTSGITCFLDRVKTFQPRIWMLDELIPLPSSLRI